MKPIVLDAQPKVGTEVTRAHAGILALILILGVVLRLTYLALALQTTNAWEDPDGYMVQALRLAGDDGWRWTFDAVTYSINGQRHALPPMYSIFLSVFALFDGFPLTARLAQIALSVASIAMVFALGLRLHSPAAGLIAAGGYALWVPNIFNVWSTSQETLYIPMVLAGFVILASALSREARPIAFGIAGVVFGAAALTRSMPMFFAVPAAAAHVAVTPDRRRAVAQAAAFLCGFLLLTAPYSAALSRHFGQLTIIDTHGSIHLETGPGRSAPGLGETAAGLWRTVLARPGGYLAECVSRARSLLHVNGGRILQIYVVADSKPAAVAWKTFVHLGTDALLILGVVLAPLGAVVCRKPRLALLLIVWTLVNIAIASLGGFGGARLRTPFEPILMIFAAVACAGAWRRPRPIAWVAAAAVSLVAAAAVLPQVPRSVGAWPDYGVRWPSIFNRQSGGFTGTAGLNVPVLNGLAVVMATTVGSSPTQLAVRVGGVPVRQLQLKPGETEPIRAFWPAGGLAYVELETAASATDAIQISVAGR